MMLTYKMIKVCYNMGAMKITTDLTAYGTPEFKGLRILYRPEVRNATGAVVYMSGRLFETAEEAERFALDYFRFHNTKGEKNGN